MNDIAMVEKEVLSDGSNVYNVQCSIDKGYIKIDCLSKKHALALVNNLNKASSVYVYTMDIS